MKDTKESVAPVVDVAPELDSVAPDYLLEEELATHGHNDAVKRLWLLWQYRQFLLRITVCGLVASAIIALFIPSRYESTTRLMPPESQSGSGLAMMAALASQSSPTLAASGLGAMASDLLGLKSSGALFLDILRSQTVQDHLIARFDLRKVYWDRYWQDARKDLSRHTDASEDRKSGVITITVTDRDPHRAVQIAQAYVEELDRLVAAVSTSSARQERIFIEQRLQTVKQDLNTAARQFSEYASKNTALDITAQGKATVEAAAELEGELIATQSQLEGLEQIYTKNNVRVRSLQARIDELRSQLHKMGGETSGSPSDNGSSTLEFPAFRQLPLLGVKWGELYRQNKIQETVFQLLTQQYELAKIQEAKEIPTVKVLDVANLPEKKSFPPRLIIALLGSVLALMGALAWIAASEAWRRTDARDPRKLLMQVVAAHVIKRVSSVSNRSSEVGEKAKRLRAHFLQHPGDDHQNGNGMQS